MQGQGEYQWSDEQFLELTGSELTPYERYRIGRDTPAPYVPNPPAQQSEAKPVISLEMKRYFAAGGFTTFCVVVIAAAEQGAFAAAAAVGGYIALVGAGIGVAWVVLRACFTWTPASDAGNGQSKTGGNNYYYQYNNFGENPNQNNGKA